MAGADVVMILVAKYFSLVRLSPVVGEMVKATDVVMMSVADDAKMFTSEIHGPCARTTGA